MATHHIPPGTINFAVNLPLPLRRDAGRIAAMQDKSLGSWLREIVEREVSTAKMRGLLDTAGQLTLRLPVLMLISMGIAAVLAQAISLDDDGNARRVRSRRGGRRRDEYAMMLTDDEEGGA